MGRFDDRATQPARGPADILRWKLGNTFKPRAEKFVTPSQTNDGSILRTDQPSLTWIGHASFVLKLANKLVALDPIWSAKIGGAVARNVAPGVALENIPNLDVVAVTHNHFDHLDLPTLKKIGNTSQYVVPLGVGTWLKDIGLENIVELDWWQSTQAGELELTLVPARHWSMRMPWTRNESLWGGFVVRGPEATIYHAGDTAFFDGFAEIKKRLPPIDYALLPIGAYEPRWFMSPQHMNPEDAGEAFLALGAKYFVAMHWGTFKLTDEPLGEPPNRLKQWWNEHKLDPDRLIILDVGETHVCRSFHQPRK